ncbi:MAG: GNAT family N-acetyltransferase, partial [Candidatus Thermoplasmatota archaeon]|nr:GNAT family N-acetyltransferase [Candidatus Thermoplasmatota archaeon]
MLGYVRSRNVGEALSKCPITNDWRRSLLTSHSFEEAYRVYILVRRGAAEVRDVPPPAGFELERKDFRDCSDEDVSMIVDVFNDSFKDHFNFAPERLERFINHRDCGNDPAVLTLASKGDGIAGLCLSDESSTFNEEKGERTGWVDIIGVRPQFRRVGLGEALLSDGMRWILDRGMDTIYLGVFAKNEKALGLYRSFGFTNDTESVWYRKKLPKDPNDTVTR